MKWASDTISRRDALGAAAAAVAAVALPGCAKRTDGRFKIVTTFTVIADIARNVAGSAAIVESITKPGSEIHNYQPTPGDLMKAQDANLLLWNGLGLELWFEQFFANLPRLPSAIVSHRVIPISISEGRYSGKPNPHAWMSPASVIIYVENILKALTQHDPGSAAIYRKNAENYVKSIQMAIEPIRIRLREIPTERRWLVTSEGAFSYLARDFGLSEAYLWPVNADQQGTPQQVRKVIDTVNRYRIPTVFSESTVSAKPAMQIARETGAAYGGVLYVDSLSEADGLVPTYIDLMRITCGRIASGLAV